MKVNLDLGPVSCHEHLYRQIIAIIKERIFAGCHGAHFTQLLSAVGQGVANQASERGHESLMGPDNGHHPRGTTLHFAEHGLFLK